MKYEQFTKITGLYPYILRLFPCLTPLQPENILDRYCIVIQCVNLVHAKTDCAIIGISGMQNFAVAVETSNILKYACSTWITYMVMDTIHLPATDCVNNGSCASARFVPIVERLNIPMHTCSIHSRWHIL